MTEDIYGGVDDTTDSDAPAPESAMEEPTTYYGSSDEFVRKQLIGTYRRRVIRHGSGSGLRWKAAWWESAEAQQRIEALWRAWEAARADASAGMSTWWINHCDPHMTVLLSQDGPFANSTDENRMGEPLPYEPPMEGLFEPDRQVPLHTETSGDNADETTITSA